MTKEEALVQLRLGPGINEDVSEEYNEAVNMAIKALQQQPNEDEKIIRIRKGTLKVRTGRYVVYDVEWLKTHFNTTEAKIYGQPKERTEERTETHECDLEQIIKSTIKEYIDKDCNDVIELLLALSKDLCERIRKED